MEFAVDLLKENVREMGERVKEAGKGLGSALTTDEEEKHSHSSGWLGILLILIGIIFLLKNLNLIRWLNEDLIWPIIIILVGAWLLIKRWR